jgi:hypothetical protein
MAVVDQAMGWAWSFLWWTSRRTGTYLDPIARDNEVEEGCNAMMVHWRLGCAQGSHISPSLPGLSENRRLRYVG